MARPKYAGGLGFRDIEMFNDALLAKIGWRLIKEPQSLLARVLLGKYARNCSFLDCPNPSSASHGWRSVLAGRNILRLGLSWGVGNGESINIWNDPWLSFKAPSQPFGPANLDSSSMKVSNLLCPLTNKWDLDKIRCWLPQYEDTILKIKTSSAPSVDTLLWLPEKSGLYSTKTGYGIGMTESYQATDFERSVNWSKHIWNVKTAPKLKDFLWKVVRKAIPVSANLERRGCPSFTCKLCGAAEDDDHVFIKCPFAAEVWSLLPIKQRSITTNLTFLELLEEGSNFTPLPPTGVTAPLWPWVIWNLWKTRNKLVFENRSFSAAETVLKSICDAKEWSQAQNEPPSSTPETLCLFRTHQRSPCSPPTFPTGVTVCNVDAAWNVLSGRCGTGGVFSGSNSPSQSIISEAHTHVSSAIMAEAIAVRVAVVTAFYSNIRSLAVLSDSLSLINMLKKGRNQPELFGIMLDIYHFIPFFEAISFVYVSRNFNVEADLVAKSALLNTVSNSFLGE